MPGRDAAADGTDNSEGRSDGGNDGRRRRGGRGRRELGEQAVQGQLDIGGNEGHLGANGGGESITAAGGRGQGHIAGNVGGGADAGTASSPRPAMRQAWDEGERSVPARPAVDITDVPQPAAVTAARAAAINERLPEPRRAAQPIRVEPYALPAADLQAVASAAGLEWVASDADKVRAVQAAMAAEPKPAHVPREPRPVAVVDEGPLVLVETRKDLSQVRLPFEASN